MGLALAAAAAAARRRGDPDRRQRLPTRARRRAPHRRRDRRRAAPRPPGGVPEQPRAADGRRPGRLPPAERAGEKLTRDGRRLELHLEPTEDILAGARGRAARGQTVVGFAAEHGEDGVERARAKLERKGADLIVLNDVSDPEIGFESEENAVTLIEPSSARSEVPIARRRTDRRRRSSTRVDRLRWRTTGRAVSQAALSGLYWLQAFSCPDAVSRSGPGPLFFRPRIK